MNTGVALPIATSSESGPTSPRLPVVLTHLGMTGDEIAAAFDPYRPAGITAALSEANLRAKLADDAFRSDLDALIADWPEGYDTGEAADLVVTEVLRKI